VEVDPAASMRIWAIELDLGGRTFTVPALPAAGWFPVLLEGNPLLVLEMIEDGPADDELDTMILSGQVGAEEMTEALTLAIEQAAGRTYHCALVLAQMAALQWAAIAGVLAERGFSWEERPLGAALDAIYAVVCQRLDKDGLDKFQQLLDNPMATKGGRRRKVSRDQAMSDFAAMAGPPPSQGARATGERSGNARSRTRTRPQQRRQPGR
jgi:hypothetical protein